MKKKGKLIIYDEGKVGKKLLNIIGKKEFDFVDYFFDKYRIKRGRGFYYWFIICLAEYKLKQLGIKK